MDGGFAEIKALQSIGYAVFPRGKADRLYCRGGRFVILCSFLDLVNNVLYQTVLYLLER